MASEIVKFEADDGQMVEFGEKEVRDLVCPEASPRDVSLFLAFCQAHKLDPIGAKDAYLVGFRDKKTGSAAGSGAERGAGAVTGRAAGFCSGRGSGSGAWADTAAWAARNSSMRRRPSSSSLLRFMASTKDRVSQKRATASSLNGRSSFMIWL